jgi:hypothetical protein
MSQRRSHRRAGVLLLVALLLVPIALSGHAHGRSPAHACAICAVTQHAPMVRAPAPPTFTARLACLLPAPSYTSVHVRIDPTPGTNRAPPSGSDTVLA